MKKLPKNIFVTGIDTNVGKTIVSAVLVESLQADYWKPIQSGNTEGTDTETIKKLISNRKTTIHPEAYSLKAATVPYHAGEREGIEIEEVKVVSLPDTDNRLIVEGAGGLMVHLRKNMMVIDLIAKLNIPVILVAKNYLGSINHTLLSIAAMRQRGIEILGIIYNGERSEHMRKLIFDTSAIPEIGTIDYTNEINKAFISRQANSLLSSLKTHFIIE
jgi:dethiobiotin synthetase